MKLMYCILFNTSCKITAVTFITILLHLEKYTVLRNLLTTVEAMRTSAQRLMLWGDAKKNREARTGS